MREFLTSPAIVFLCVCLGVFLLALAAAFLYTAIHGVRAFRESEKRFNEQRERIEADIEATRSRIGFNMPTGGMGRIAMGRKKL